MAQQIVHSGAMQDAAFWNSMTNAAQATKTACKVGLFVSATVVTGGGTFSALAGNSFTAVQAGAAIVGGTDCMVDIGATGCNIFLGEDHQVSVALGDIKDKLAPVSAIVGLATFNPAETGEQLAYIGETLADWFFDGKIMGIKLAINKNGSTDVKAQSINISNIDREGVSSAIEDAGFIVPKESAKTLLDLIGDYAIEPTVTIEKLEALAEKMEKIAGLVDKRDEQNTAVGKKIDGLYEGTATITESKNSSHGEVSEMQLRIEQRDDSTMALINEEEELEVIGSYNKDTNEFCYETGGEVNFIIQLKFHVEGDTITAKGTNTINQTGQGWTQRVSTDLKKTAN